MPSSLFLLLLCLLCLLLTPSVAQKSATTTSSAQLLHGFSSSSSSSSSSPLSLSPRGSLSFNPSKPSISLKWEPASLGDADLRLLGNGNFDESFYHVVLEVQGENGKRTMMTTIPLRLIQCSKFEDSLVLQLDDAGQIVHFGYSPSRPDCNNKGIHSVEALKSQQPFKTVVIIKEATEGPEPRSNLKKNFVVPGPDGKPQQPAPADDSFFGRYGTYITVFLIFFVVSRTFGLGDAPQQGQGQGGQAPATSSAASGPRRT